MNVYTFNRYTGYDAPQVQPNGLPSDLGNVPLPVAKVSSERRMPAGVHTQNDGLGYSAFAAETGAHSNGGAPFVPKQNTGVVGPSFWKRMLSAVAGIGPQRVTDSGRAKTPYGDSGSGNGAPAFGSSPVSGSQSFYSPGTAGIGAPISREAAK